VTADHGHAMVTSGYAQRGNPIMGLVRHASSALPEGRLALDSNGQPYIPPWPTSTGPGSGRPADLTSFAPTRPRRTSADPDRHPGLDRRGRLPVLQPPRLVGSDTAAAVGATYGSNSTMTFIAAASFLTALDLPYGACMIVALVLMETPAIIYSVFLARRDRSPSTWETFRDALTDGTHLLLIGSLIIGAVSTSLSGNEELLYRFVGGDLFTGAATWLLGTALGMSSGNLFLTIILMASASCIVAPAILEKTVSRAESGKYLTMSIAVTFPMNILIGVPAWWSLMA